jgi:hypothetical protein
MYDSQEREVGYDYSKDLLSYVLDNICHFKEKYNWDEFLEKLIKNYKYNVFMHEEYVENLIKII